MRIAIDVSQAVYGTGVSFYVKNLVNNLVELDKSNEYLLFAGVFRRRDQILKLFPHVKTFPIPPTVLDVLWNRIHIFPVEKITGNIDVVHTSDWAEPPSRAFKVTTVHDVAPFLYPSLFPRDVLRNIVATHKHRLSLVKKESNRIIVPTNSTKSDLVNLGFKDGVIRVIPEAASDNMRRVDEKVVELTKRKYFIHGKYLLSVGMDPRKNTERIIKAFEHATAGKDIKLVFVGQPKYMKIKENRNIRVLGRVDDKSLASLYSGAEALVYPSLYEGFGLPILEAMACGCPVITSNISSMAEVAGNAALLVDPYNTDSIASAIESVLRGAKSYVEKGLKRAGQFSWRDSALKTLDVYNESKR